MPKRPINVLKQGRVLIPKNLVSIKSKKEQDLAIYEFAKGLSQVQRKKVLEHLGPKIIRTDAEESLVQAIAALKINELLGKK